MKYRRSEDSQPFLYEGGGNPDDGPADNEAGGDKKEEISDEEAMKRAIERNKELIAKAKQRAAKQHNLMEGDEPHLTADRINAAFAAPFRKRLCCEFWVWGILYALFIIIAEL